MQDGLEYAAVGCFIKKKFFFLGEVVCMVVAAWSSTESTGPRCGVPWIVMDYVSRRSVVWDEGKGKLISVDGYATWLLFIY